MKKVFKVTGKVTSSIVLAGVLATSIFIGLSAINRAKNLDLISSKVPDLFKVNALNNQQAYLLASLAFTLAAIILLGMVYGVIKSIAGKVRAADNAGPNQGNYIEGCLEAAGGFTALLVAAAALVPIIDLSLYLSGRDATMFLHKVGFTQPIASVDGSFIGNPQAAPVVAMLTLASLVLFAAVIGGGILCFNGTQNTPQCCVNTASVCCPCPVNTAEVSFV